ncbi:unnamed protein product [Periconia digitata]|uniref:non-specific serine/threonine protein kinase n=1 Tax=Periconia digitata TaxID=1303443 RepID=A0A9W4U540_9PLEO|nr:unnamed protein product [Periconia digitata]
MSSAAVQQSGPAIANRSYQQPAQYSTTTTTTTTTQQYPHHPHQQQSSAGASSAAAARKPSRKSSNGASPNTPTTPQSARPSSDVSSSNNNLTANRQHPPTTSQYSPSAMPSAASAPMPPPRSSSHRSAQSPTTPRQDPSRRKDKESPRHHGASSRSKPSPSQPSHSRSASAVGQPPTGTTLPREESTVINRIVVADPQEDVARERARQAEAVPAASGADITPITGLGLVGSEGVDDGGRGAGRSRQDHSQGASKRSKFGNYILGQTLGEGEFGKVKMGWKKDSSVEVAIKLIRRETLGGNQNRLQKIYREIQILRGLEHPNIVRLHEMVETERHIGIILEYASGGELFDFILNHRYLKDGAARRLFAQLISGVGYLHKKGIVHRDLKLENLLLDRNRNIIITDFGFANTFDANDEVGEEIEFNLGNKEFIKSLGLEGGDGPRRGDLMQTSCGSPCYAAPELVVSDSLYTGRKVDVWSCGVILYAMLAGYLPFDDDPANPDGDNINLLYKYIVSTPLTFPEYVTPHARDLLKRILVPDPRKRADLFEVARHSWLSDYAHVVSFITSSATNSNDIQKATGLNHDAFDTAPTLARSASVREPGKASHTTVSPVGGLTAKREQINQQPSEKAKKDRDTKRRTVQVEYVAPQSQTTRGEASPPSAPMPSSKTRVKESGPTEVPSTDGYNARPSRSAAGPATAASPQSRREPQRSVSDYTAFGNVPPTSAARPSTGGTLGANSRLPSRGNSYSQPSTAAVAQTNVEGRFSQPKGKQYHISTPAAQPEPVMGQPSISQPPAQRVQSIQAEHKGHKRSNTSTESSRRTSFGFSRKNATESSSGGKPSRRFSLLPSSLSKTFSSNHRESMPASSQSDRRGSMAGSSRPRASSRPGMGFGRGADSRSPSQSTTGSNVPAFYDGPHEGNTRGRGGPSSAPANQTHFNQPPIGDDKFPNPRDPHPASNARPYHFSNESESSEPNAQVQNQTHAPQYPPGMGSDGTVPETSRKGVLQKSRKFVDAYEESGGNKGSSGSSKRVMDFFRRMGRQRGKEDR